MELLRYYAMVVRAAFSHSLTVTQDIIFAGILVVGAAVWLVPHWPMIPDLTPWLPILSGSKIAAIAFGSIIAIRLLLAPYWIDKEAKKKITEFSKQSKIELSPAIIDEQEELHPAKYIQVSVHAVGNLPGCQIVLMEVSKIENAKSTLVYSQPLNAGWSGIGERSVDINDDQTLRANLFSVSYVAGYNGYGLMPQTFHRDRALHQAVNPPGVYELTIHASSKMSPPETKKFLLHWGGTLNGVQFWEPPPS